MGGSYSSSRTLSSGGAPNLCLKKNTMALRHAAASPSAIRSPLSFSPCAAPLSPSLKAGSHQKGSGSYAGFLTAFLGFCLVELDTPRSPRKLSMGVSFAWRVSRYVLPT